MRFMGGTFLEIVLSPHKSSKRTPSARDTLPSAFYERLSNRHQAKNPSPVSVCFQKKASLASPKPR